MNTAHVAVLVGSLRQASFSRKIANAVIALAPDSLRLEIVEIGQLPLYNQDDDASPPAASAAFKSRIKAADAVLFVTPGSLGAFGAHHHLRQSLVFLNVPAMPQPEAYISNVSTLFDDAGKLTNESTRGFLGSFTTAFSAWIAANTRR